MSEDIYLEGLREVEEELNEQIENIKGDTTEAIQDIGLDLLGKSVELAPVRYGDLRGSGSVRFEGKTIAEGTKKGSVRTRNYIKKPIDNPVAVIGYYVPYAAAQHQHVEYEHQRGGEALYLQTPMMENIPQYVKHIKEKAEVD